MCKPISTISFKKSGSHFIPAVFCGLALLLGEKHGNAQEPEPAVPVVKLSGYVKSDVFYDTRQVVSAREGHLLLFPAAMQSDAEGKDINARGGFNMLPIQSNLSVNVSGATIMGASVSACVEGDFFGQANVNINLFRLRHAYVKMKWNKTEILAGQYWHPLFVTSAYPGTVSFNTGAPLQPFSRAPQLRLTQEVNLVRFSLSLLSQRDYASNGPDGVSSKYLKDAGIPEVQFSAELKTKGEHEFIAGMGMGYKQIMPEIKTKKNYSTRETVGGFSAIAYLKKTARLITFKLEGIYLENGSELLSIGGYAVKDTLDAARGIVSYAPLRTLSVWSELQTNGKVVKVGVFGGYSQNLGTKPEVQGPFYLTCNLPIQRVWRIAPRITVTRSNLMFAAEVEYTAALYGTPDDHAIMRSTNRTGNVRFLTSIMYRF
jgi:hypothetical protein